LILRSIFGSGDIDSIKILILKILIVNWRNVFFYDELYYWIPQELGGFLDVTGVNKMFVIVVILLELFIGVKGLMNKWCYEFEIIGETLRFYLDGVVVEGYE